jgi:hypothetical protein
MAGVLDALVIVVARGVERTPAGAAAAALLATLPKRDAPSGSAAGGTHAGASAHASSAALEEALRLGLLTSPHGEECAAAAAASAAAALVLRNLSHTAANATPLLTARTVIAIAAHAIAVEAASVAAPLEPGWAAGADEEAVAAERSAAVDDLMEMLLNLAPAMCLVAPAGQQPAPAVASAAAGGADAMPSRVAAAVCASLRSAAPRRAASGAELLCRLYTRANAAAFRPGGVFGAPPDIVPPLLSLLASHERDAAGAAMAAAALARLSEVPAHCAAIAHAHGIVRVLLAAATGAHAAEGATRYALATLAALAEAPGTPVAPAVMAADVRLTAIVAAGGPGASYAARAVAAAALFPSAWR